MCLAPPPDLLSAYTAQRADLARFLLARLGNPADAEDVLQELFLKVSRTATNDVIDPAAYLYRMAMNLARDFRRGARARSRDTDWAEASNTLASSDAQDEAPSPESAIGAKQRLAQIRSVLDELPSQTRRIFLLHKMEEQSHQEIAVALGISRSSVEKRVRAALTDHCAAGARLKCYEISLFRAQRTSPRCDRRVRAAS